VVKLFLGAKEDEYEEVFEFLEVESPLGLEAPDLCQWFLLLI